MMDYRKQKENSTLLKEIQPSINSYLRIGRRDPILFNWILYMSQNVHLSSIDKKYMDRLCIVKTKLTILITLLDDIVDDKLIRNPKLFKHLIKIPFSKKIVLEDLTEKEKEYFNITKEIWDDIYSEIKKFPCFSEFEEILEFDLHQTINAMRYGLIINEKPEMANLLESLVYEHHSMIIIIAGDLDLMCSPNFDKNELKYLREVLYISQQMAKIGNIYNTYPREILEGDISTEPIIYHNQMQNLPVKDIQDILVKNKMRIKSFDDLLSKRWEMYYKSLDVLSKNVKSVDMKKFKEIRKFIQAEFKKKIDNW